MQEESTTSHLEFILEQNPVLMTLQTETPLQCQMIPQMRQEPSLTQDNGIITLKDGVGLEATVNDIEENPYNVEIVELAAEQVARVAEETSYIVLNGNYALQAGYSVSKDALAYETSDSEAAKTYVNVIAVKEGNENSDKIKALVDVLKSDEIKDFINEKYDGAVIPFEDSEDTEAVDDAQAEDSAETEDSAEAEDAADTAEETEAE